VCKSRIIDGNEVCLDQLDLEEAFWRRFSRFRKEVVAINVEQREDFFQTMDSIWSLRGNGVRLEGDWARIVGWFEAAQIQIFSWTEIELSWVSRTRMQFDTTNGKMWEVQIWYWILTLDWTFRTLKVRNLTFFFKKSVYGNFLASSKIRSLPKMDLLEVVQLPNCQLEFQSPIFRVQNPPEIQFLSLKFRWFIEISFEFSKAHAHTPAQ
jgi:hypothetical protein